MDTIGNRYKFSQGVTFKKPVTNISESCSSMLKYLTLKMAPVNDKFCYTRKRGEAQRRI